MPVTVLLCEGGPKSPDFRLLFALCANLGLALKSSGGKYGLGDRVLAERDARPNSLVAALKDRDFDAEPGPPTGQPRRWSIRQNDRDISLGWSWERKEIENYLIDPLVVQQALGEKAPDATIYRRSLDEAAETLAAYTAARIALSLARPRWHRLPNAWGPERGKDHHPFPGGVSPTVCRAEIERVLSEYGQTYALDPVTVLQKYEDLLAECRPSGVRFQYYLTFFSGKDLLWGIENALKAWDFESPYIFRESILRQLERSTDNVWDWLPEWSALREALKSYSPD